MNRIQALFLMALASSVLSCGKQKEQYFVNGGFVLPNSQSNVIREFSFFAEDSQGVAYGFNLDELNSTSPKPDTCYVEDLVDPSGRVGIDNQLARIWTDLEPLVGEAVQGLLHGAINEGRFLLMIELEGLDNWRNDDDVTVHLLRGRLKPEIGTQGMLAPDQTFYADEEFPASRVEKVQVVDGYLEAGPVEFVVPIDILDAKFLLKARSGKLRLRINEDGTFEGHLGGFLTPSEFLSKLYETGAEREARVVAPFFEDNTDSNPVDGRCTDFSAAFGFKGTTAFIVRTQIPR